MIFDEVDNEPVLVEKESVYKFQFLYAYVLFQLIFLQGCTAGTALLYG